MPALCALIRGNTMARGSTRRKRIPNRVKNEIRIPEKSAVSHSPKGMNWKKTTRMMTAMNASASTTPRLSIDSSTAMSSE